jgi:D-3-phosphoglycerate dehydrogenase
MAYRIVILDGPGDTIDVEAAELATVGGEVERARSAQRGEIERLVAAADAILCDATAIDAALLDGAPRVQIISEYGIGYDNIDVGAASQRGIWVSNVPGFCVEEVADHTLALILAANRRLLQLDRSVRAGRWDPVGVSMGADRLSNQTLGLIGFGQIGQRVSRRAAGFGLRVLAYSRSLTEARATEHGAALATFDQILHESDYVSLHLPAGAATRNLIASDALARMKPNAWLINTSRGSLVDEDALATALRERRIAGAALDVRRSEEPTASDALYEFSNVILTPHAAWYSAGSLRELRQRAARNVAAVLAGGTPIAPVNPYIKPRFGPDAETHPTWV